MKRILITIDDDTAKVLDGSPNKSKLVRDALEIYQKDISTDTLAGIKQAFEIMLKRLKELEEHLDTVYEIVERVERSIEEAKHS